MKAVVQNFRGISEAQIAISPIALLTGKNGAGKTSIARAIAAAVSGRSVPYEKVTKKDCGIMLRAGTKSGTVTVSNDTGSTTVEWPKADAQSDGQPPHASPIAAGLTDIFSMKDKEALTYLINLLRADIGESDFIKAMTEKGIGEETIKAAWSTVHAQGWEAAHTRAKERGTKLKGVWENTTGEKFGSKKVDSWFPAEWDDSLTVAEEPSLRSDIEAARKTLEEAIGKNAIGQAERESLKGLAESHETLEMQASAARLSVVALEDKLAKVTAELRSNPSPGARSEYSCPHCDGKIHIKAVSGSEYTLSKAEKVDAARLQDARMKDAQLCGQQQNLSQQVADSTRKLTALTSDLEKAKAAKEKLKQIGEMIATADESTLQTCRDDVHTAEKRLKIFEVYYSAKKTAAMIADNQVIVELLDEKGLRRNKLSECLIAFENACLRPLAEAFGITSISLDADLNALLGKTPYPMLSASEQFRVRTVVQLAIAHLEHANLVIIDGADILDQPSRGKLLQAVLKNGIPAIICMTLNKPDAAPDLAAVNAGQTYWVSDGTCRAYPFTEPHKAEEKDGGFFGGMRRKSNEHEAAA